MGERDPARTLSCPDKVSQRLRALMGGHGGPAVPATGEQHVRADPEQGEPPLLLPPLMPPHLTRAERRFGPARSRPSRSEDSGAFLLTGVAFER